MRATGSGRGHLYTVHLSGPVPHTNQQQSCRPPHKRLLAGPPEDGGCQGSLSHRLLPAFQLSLAASSSRFSGPRARTALVPLRVRLLAPSLHSGTGGQRYLRTLAPHTPCTLDDQRGVCRAKVVVIAVGSEGLASVMLLADYVFVSADGFFRLFPTSYPRY